MGANFSGGGATVFHDRTDAPGEIIRELVNSTDGQGLHFNGSSGNIDIASPPNLGTKFSFEFIVQADAWGAAEHGLVDFGTGGRFYFYASSGTSYNLAVYSVAGASSFGVKVLDDLKVHHLVLTIDGTSAILYDNGNQVGTATITSPNIDSCSDARIGSDYAGTGGLFNGTLYRTRFWNKTLTSAEVTATYENATVPFADQYGSQSEVMPNATDRNFSGANNWVNVDLSAFNSTDDLTVSSTGGAQECRLAEYGAPMIGGKSYRVTVTASALSGDGFTLRDFDNVVLAKAGTLYRNGVYVSNDTLQLADGSNVFEFVYAGALGATNGGLMVRSDGTGSITCDDFSVRKIGCSVDVDCAFSNPTQSLLVQDRAGNADGTSSATGVTQVTKIEAVNTNKLNVGGTTPLVGIGLAAGSTPSAALDVSGTSNGVARIRLTNTAGTANVWSIGPNYNSQDLNISPNDGASVVTITEAGGITTAGNVGVGVSPAANQVLQVKVASNVNLSVSHDSGNVRLNAVNDAADTNVPMELTASSYQFIGGNVGVGGSPVATWSPNQTITTASNSQSSALVLANTNTSLADDYTVGVIEAQAGAGNRIAAIRFKTEGTAENSGDITLETGSGGTAVERVRVDSTGLTTVKNPGWPLKNELTNSGFDVWSNSTLENVATVLDDDAASDDTGDWTKGGGATLAFDTDHYTITAAGANAEIYQTSAFTALTAGKLYQLSITVKDGTEADMGCIIRTLNSGGAAVETSPTFRTTSSFVTHTFVVESDGTERHIAFKITSSLGGDNIQLKDISLKEVTPGIVTGAKGPDGWQGTSSMNMFREHSGGNTKTGAFYSCKTVTAATARFMHPSDQTSDAWLGKVRGRTMTMGFWAKTSTANHVRIGWYDDGYTYSDYCPNDGDWHWLELTETVGTGSNTVSPVIRFEATGATAYISQPMLVFGSAIGAGNYSAPSGETIYFEGTSVSNKFSGKTGFSDIGITTMNAEADSNGKIPKGAKAIMFKLAGNDSGSSGDDPAFQTGGLSSLNGMSNDLGGMPNDMRKMDSGWTACDANGDYDYFLDASGSGTFDFYYGYNYIGVQLR